jgi:translation initiation factor IF-2-like protein
MSKRVYEIARELNLSTKEVMGRLNDAGIEVKSHFAVIEDPVYERVFGAGSDGVAPNGGPEAQESEALSSTIQSPRKRSPARRILVYVLVAALAFALAASVGAMGALVVRGDLSLLGREDSRSPDEQANAPRENAPRPQQDDAAADQQQQQEEEREAAAERQRQEEQQQQQQEEREAAARQREAEEAQEEAQEEEEEYVARVGQIQANAVETFLDSYQKLLRYDALGGDDLQQMRSNEAALEELSTEVENLDAPQEYQDHYEVFGSAIDELNAGVQLAYDVVADPTTATKSDFDNYDRHAQEGAELLERSNEMLGRDYKSIEGIQEISPL